MRFFINETEKAIVDSWDGNIIRPSCIDDLTLYVKYLGINTPEGQGVLEAVVRGEKVITMMINHFKGVHDATSK